MKKLLTLILAVTLILPAASSASVCVSNVYTLFIDADTYNRQYGAGFNFDSAIFDLVILSEGKTAYYCKQMWQNGVRTSTDYIECIFTSSGNTFTLTFKDGTVFDGYFDPDQNSVWICFGQNTYFRFSSVHRYDAVDDINKK